ncbi:hypothetical protein K469DRAFT_579464, partial [Zopfia rhizophila CBS 207.26]
EKLLSGFRCAEVLELSLAADPVRLRIARIWLYHYFEQRRIDLHTDPSTLGKLSSGKTIASVVTDEVLNELHSTHDKRFRPQSRKQRRKSLQRHKKLGKRWLILATHLGLGILITCSTRLEVQM